MSKLRPAVAVLLTAVLCLLFLTGCRPGSRYPKLNLHPTGAVEATQPPEIKRPLRLAIAPVYSPKRSRASYQGLAAYLSEKLDRPIEVIQRTTYAEIMHLFKEAEIDLGLTCGLPYVLGHDDFGLELLAVPVINGDTKYRSYLIVPAEYSINTLEELWGKTIAFSDPYSFSGRLYLLHRLSQMGETVDLYFENYTYTYSHDYSIRAVVDRVVTAAVVNSVVYHSLVRENPVLERLLKVIEASPPVGNPPMVVHPGLPPELRDAIRQAFLAMHLDPEGQKILAQMGFERFTAGEDSEYDYIRLLLDEIDK